MDEPTPLILRPAIPAERMELEGLQWRAALALEVYRDALMADPDAIELSPEQIAAGQVTVAERGGAVIGLSVVLTVGDGEAELDGLFVEPGSWRTGVGRRLVEAAADGARGDGAASLRVVANPLALAFYKACGFDLIGRCDTRFGMGLTMRKLL